MADAAARRLAARIAGLSLHALRDSNAIASRARRGLEEKFRLQALSIDPSLTGEALGKKAAILKRLHFTKLAARSAKVRARRKISPRRQA